MDPISFTVGILGLTGLFSVCLDVIERVDSYKDFGVESRGIIAQFEADKHLFTKWAQDVGISKDESKKDYHSHLDDPEKRLIVQNILLNIQETFSKTEGMMSNLQPVVEAGPTSFPDGIRFLNIRRKSQKPQGAIKLWSSRIRWSFRDKAKFFSIVQQFGVSVQKLHSLVPPNDLSSRNDEDKDTWFQQQSIKREKQIEHDKRKELDDWLSASWTNDDYHNFVQKRLDGTCDWILSRQAFIDWISPDFPSRASKILWINGPAGYGKTILCAKVVHYLSTILNSPPAYYFCSAESETQRNPLTIMRSWVSQIISRNPDAFQLAYCKWETTHGRHASQTDIVDLFGTIVQHIPNCTFTFVVDGIDECAWAAEKWKYKYNDEESPEGFFESIKSAVANTTTRILILSRDEPEIRRSLYPVIASDGYQYVKEYQICPDDVRSDTTLFSRSIIEKKLANKSETVKNELTQRMADRCGGIFLWVKILEDQLRSGKNKKQLEEIIDQTPTALSHLYDRNWMKISHLPDKDKLRAFSILRWAAFALRPLTILEITEALVVDDYAEDLSIDELPEAIDEYYISTEIQGLCGSLLETRKAAVTQDLGSMTIHLAHFSVKQYILCNLPVQGELLMVNERLRETFQSNILAKLCLRYLNFRIVWQEPFQLQSDLDKRPFREYAAGSWYQHTKENDSNYAEVVELTSMFFSSHNRNWESWKKWFDSNDDKSKMPESLRAITWTNPLFYASLLGLRGTVIYLLKEAKVCVNQVNEFKGTAVQAAASKGQTSIVELLLEKGADVTIGNREGWTPLSLASNGGHVEVVKLLLEKGADMAVATQSGWTPLNLASDSGHVEVVRLLLEKGADVAVANRNDGWTPLNLASRNGHVKIVKLLLEKGADMAIASRGGWTPLKSAANNGHIEVVELLLKRGANIAVTSQDGWTPLNSAASDGHVEVVKLLLEKGADITVRSNEGWTPLNSAATNGHVEVVKLLLEKGADVVVTNQNKWTPLMSAASNGHFEVVKLLLEKGADMTVASKEGRTPLILAAGNGHVEVIKLLLEKGANVAVVDQNGSTPLIFAASNGRVEVTKLLLEKGAGMAVANQNGWTALNFAAHNGHVEVIKLLLEKGADVEVASQNKWTPLMTAASNGHFEVVELLLENGACIAAATQDGVTSLHLSCFKGYIDVVKLLLEKGAEVTVRSNEGWTPLNSAVTNGHVEIVKLLLEKGADVVVTNQNKWRPLISAVQNGHVEVVKLLLENEADIATATQDIAMPLQIASSSGHVEIVKLLLEKGPDVNTQDTQLGRTSLSRAAENGHEAVVKLMLAADSIEPDLKDRIGRTPLLYAAKNGHKATVQLLLATNQIDVDSKDYYNSTPLSIAVRMGHIDVVALLLTQSQGLSIRDNFGRSPLWWARKAGHSSIANLLLEKYKEIGMVVQEDDLRTTRVLALANKSSRACDVCVLGISEKDTYYHCGVCSNGDFDICKECFAMTAHCLDESHSLIKK